MDRIIGAFTFRRGVYAEVEHDTTFTTTAWIIVVIVAVLNQIGSNASAGFDNILGWAGGGIIGTIFAVVAFAVGVAVVNWIGRAVFIDGALGGEDAAPTELSLREQRDRNGERNACCPSHSA